MSFLLCTGVCSCGMVCSSKLCLCSSSEILFLLGIIITRSNPSKILQAKAKQMQFISFIIPPSPHSPGNTTPCSLATR
jgi:hypothetical protein